MSNTDVKILDCTLRDGGYINDWNWGFSSAKDIIATLCRAGVDIIEVGFLRNVDEYDPNRTVCNSIEELNRLLPEKRGSVLFAAMAMRSNYDITKLSPYSGNGIELIRVTAHDYDLSEGMEFARCVKNLGYKVSINPINIMGYSDSEILEIIRQVNEIQPYQFSIVDTFGSMKRRDLDRIVSLVDHNLDHKIRVALHLHENMSISVYLAQSFLDYHLTRPITIDGSLMGMGRTPGNLPIELISDYLNETRGTLYELDYMMDLVQDYIAPLKGETKWGYTPAFFLSARFNLHRNYAEYYLEKGDLTNRDINHILSRIDRSKATVFDKDYAEELYYIYMNHRIDDTEARNQLEILFANREILIVAPGSTIVSHKAKIKDYQREKHPIVISVNFIPDTIRTDYAFFSNSKRYDKYGALCSRLIVTSNIEADGANCYRLDYNGLSGAFTEGCNSLVMLLKLLKELRVDNITIAGADGYRVGENNYYDLSIRSSREHGRDFNQAVVQAIHKLGVKVTYLTPSAYQE